MATASAASARTSRVQWPPSPLFAHVEEEGESDSDDATSKRLALVVDPVDDLERTSAEADADAARKKQRNVFVPVVCSIFGVVLFMRLGALVGALGLPAAVLVICVAFTVTLLTIGSLSALASAAFAELSSHGACPLTLCVSLAVRMHRR